MHVGTYPTRNCALLFLLATRRTLSSPTYSLYVWVRDIWSLYGHVLDYVCITADKVATALVCLTYNRSSPTAHFPKTVSSENVRYLRTIIVIADIDRGLYSPAKQITPLHPPYLTFRHWSGVTLYTSTYVFAESCVFVKQSPGNLSLRPQAPCGARAGLIPKLRPLFCRVP